MDGWTDGRTDRYIDRYIDRQMHKQISLLYYIDIIKGRARQDKTDR